MVQQKLTEVKRERKYYSETDFLRVEVRKLAEELEKEIKNTSRLTKKECREILNKLYGLKVNREKGLLRRLLAYFY